MVFYRKYRPQTIDELDSEKVREQLKSVLLTKSVPHAFLFTGPKGLGKTSTARIVAKVVNCERLNASGLTLNATSIPCNECDACVSITKGTNIDVLEIDGASNRGIDEIRDLREKARLAPSISKKKVYIIDEVHMLTTEAFNALLKTIEEPPDHVMFLFCTTEPHKVPATILSRCFHIAFARATDEEIVHSLERIITGESLQADDDALLAIAQMADGGFRDAAKMLEEVSLTAKEKKITKEVVEQKFQISNFKFQISELLQCLEKRDAKEALKIISESVAQGTDMKYFLQQLLETLHELLLQKSGLNSNNWKFDIGNLTLEISEIITLVSLLSRAYQDMRFAVVPQLPIEIAIIQWCSVSETTEVSQTVTAVNSVVSNGKPTIHSLTRKQHELKVQSVLHPVKEVQKKIVESTHEQSPIPANHDANTSILENMIYKTKAYNHSVAAVLRGCKVIAVDDRKLVLEAGYKFHKERLDEKKSKDVLEKVLKEITGKTLQITVELRK